MPTSREELKARLKAEAEAAIERMFEEWEAGQRLTLTEIERMALKAGRAVEEEASQGLAEHEGTEMKLSQCPDCGGKLQDKGLKTKYVLSEAGELQLKRRYYYCPHCRKGIFPPG